MPNPYHDRLGRFTKKVSALQAGDHVVLGNEAYKVTGFGKVPAGKAYGNPKGTQIDVHLKAVHGGGRTATRVEKSGVLAVPGPGTAQPGTPAFEARRIATLTDENLKKELNFRLSQLQRPTSHGSHRYIRPTERAKHQEAFHLLEQEQLARREPPKANLAAFDDNAMLSPVAPADPMERLKGELPAMDDEATLSIITGQTIANAPPSEAVRNAANAKLLLIEQEFARRRGG
jgi:hypothetical protein